MPALDSLSIPFMTLFHQFPLLPHFIQCCMFYSFCLLLKCWFHSRVTFSSHSTHFLSAVFHYHNFSKFTYAHDSQIPLKSFALSAIKRWEVPAANSVVVQEVPWSYLRQNVTILCHMIQVAILALRWPRENSLDSSNLFHNI